MRSRLAPTVAVLSALLFACSGLAQPDSPGQNAERPASEMDPAVDPALFDDLSWRLIGPFRGGRATTVAGIADDPFTYYFGATGGGVWKTRDAGISWENVSDGFFGTGSVGVVAVAPSDSNVVYAGMGESPIRGVATSHGDGVYRSTDGGRTWTHLDPEGELGRSEHISKIEVDPRDPDRLFVAAQGSAWRDNPERGIYRSDDGGATWEKVLHSSAAAGASDLSMDPTNPRILYAAFWDHRRTPWQVRSGGPGSGVWKTTDGGDTWTRLEKGLPEEMGKVGVAVSPARPERVWAIIEADEGGLFRSDDAGESWRRVNSERVLRTRAWYYTHVFAHPTDAETVFVLNAPMMRSNDGGVSFHQVDTPHGDNHDLWINPRDPRWMANANDGGANVSANAGATWSTQNNQPTAQFYRVDTDDTFPYRIYGGQQDNSTVAIPSAAPGGIGREDWFAVGGCESAHVAFDPQHPRLVYAGCYQGLIDETDVVTGRQRSIMAVPFLGLGVDPEHQPYRWNWNAPIETSPHDRSVIYHAANVLFRSDDRGVTWEAISPDLTRNQPEYHGPGGGPITNEAAGGEVYNTIMYVAPSPHEEGTIWVGTDDGLVHLTRDEGETWEQVTPPALAGEADHPPMINAIEVSPHDPARAYLAVTFYKWGDYRPMAFETRDYGVTWRSIVSDDLPQTEFVRVVREDPVRPDLLYLGTEAAVHVSFDGGDGGRRWQPLQLGLPVVPVTDLMVRQGDLVAATQGRGFWALDDLAPLRQAADLEDLEGDLHFYEPSPVHRLVSEGGFGGPSDGTPQAENPPSGAVLDYVLSEALAERLAPTQEGSDEEPLHLTLEIRDSAGELVRELTSEPPAPGAGGGGPFGGGPRPLPAEAGMNRFEWNLRSTEVDDVDGFFYFGSLAGPTVPPGTYTATLAAGDESITREIELLEDPRIDTASPDYAAQQALLARVRETLADLHRQTERARAARTQVEQEVAHAEHLGDDHPGTQEIAEAGQELVDSLTAWEESIAQTKTANFQDIINYPNRLNFQVVYLYTVIDGNGPPVSVGAKERATELADQWAERKAEVERLLSEEVPAFNALVAEHGVPAVVVPEGDADAE